MKTYLNLVGFGITLTLVNETGLIPNKDGAEFEAPRAGAGRARTDDPRIMRSPEL